MNCSSRPAAVLLVVSALFGCAQQHEGDAYRKVPHWTALEAKVPADATPNGDGEPAGFGSKHGRFGFELEEVHSGDPVHLYEAKQSSLNVEKWLISEDIEDGWVLAYESTRRDLSGDKARRTGIDFSFEVQREIGAQLIRCKGTVSELGGMHQSVKACRSLRAR